MALLHDHSTGIPINGNPETMLGAWWLVILHYAPAIIVFIVVAVLLYGAYLYLEEK